MRVFRLAAARFARSRKEAFSGQGGLQASARWHTAGRAAVYAAQSLSLAALEILVHLKQTNDLQPSRFFVVEIPEKFILMPPSYPARWQTEYRISRAFGDAWLKASEDRKSTRLNSSHRCISYAVFCLKKKKATNQCRGRIE